MRADLHVVLALLREADRVARGVAKSGITMGVHGCPAEVLSLGEEVGGVRTHYTSDDGRSEWDCVDVRLGDSMISLFGEHSMVGCSQVAVNEQPEVIF